MQSNSQPYVHHRSSPEQPHRPPQGNNPGPYSRDEHRPYYHPTDYRPYYPQGHPPPPTQQPPHQQASVPPPPPPPRRQSHSYADAPNGRSNYYDPVDRREPPSDWQYSPTRQQQVRDPYIYPEPSNDRPRTPPRPASPLDYHRRPSYTMRSPEGAQHPPRSMDSRSAYTTPVPIDHQPYTNGGTPVSPANTQTSAPSSARKGAMSISALLSNDEPAPAPPALAPPPPQPVLVAAAAPPQPPPAIAPPLPVLEPKPKRKYTRRQPVADKEIKAERPTSSTRGRNAEPKPRKSRSLSAARTMDIDVDDHQLRGRKKTPKVSHVEDNHIAIDIDVLEADETDVDDAVYEPMRMAYAAKVKKRHAETERLETEKRKRRRLNLQTKYHDHFYGNAVDARARVSNDYQEAASKIISEKESIEDKERKKEMQRKRRREKAAIDAAAKAEAAQKLAAEAAEKERVEREKAREEGRPYPPDERGTLLTFKGYDNGADSNTESMGQGGDDEPKKMRRKPGPKPRRRALDPDNAGTDDGKDPKPFKPRPRIIKKAADKDAVKAGGEEENQDVVNIKEEEQVVVVKEIAPLGPSKIYNQLYDAIWKDMARKDVSKVYKQQQVSLATKQTNLRKTSQLAAKEARRWQARTNKNTKDVQARAKRCMREMINYWKRNERDERDSRKRAEKEALDQAKKDEEMREARRQARKLNFLISQTELYSHFIGKKVKTDEVERSTDNGAVGTKISVSDANAEAEKLGSKVTKVDEIDFDNSDDEALNLAAKTNAHMAVEEARLKAQAFNKGADPKMDISKVNLDDNEDMNFQNPTSLGDTQIDQPKMLNCQLKEYQLKGLNWLVNLYEQGINGILADEMGLGKTVQSISVMAYLAEHHNIWGPFLVIAPASTLHNWQQEITRFVPGMKVLPYWGTTNDRKTLRKFWDRRSGTYTKDSQFHVLITSYQLVVQDVAYFQKMKWQYMILDEAQAIKSSSSSRWKALLAFHCRNRLLLTGTPIQNSMQELWALLHFIMPTLFDSHDEFSEWFSKDIESHAQSNTQLNEAQLKRLHMILKPFMLRRIKKHVQSELGDKIEIDVYCQLTYRQRALYRGLRNQINLIDIAEKAIMGDGDESSTSLMNLVMQFRKVCNHPDLFERADVKSPFSFARFPETASFMREGNLIDVPYTVHNFIEYNLPKLLSRGDGRLGLPSESSKAGFNHRYLNRLLNIWAPDAIAEETKKDNSAFSWLRFVDTSVQEASNAHTTSLLDRALALRKQRDLSLFFAIYDEETVPTPAHAMLLLNPAKNWKPLSDITSKNLSNLMNISKAVFEEERLHRMEPMATVKATAPPIIIQCNDQGTAIEQEQIMFDKKVRNALYGPSSFEEQRLLEDNVNPICFPAPKLLPDPISEVAGFTSISVPSMRSFVADSGKMAVLDNLLKELKNGGHRVLLYFQMTRMIDLMEEYLSYRQYRYLRLDGSSKLEDRRDMVIDWQTKPEIFIFLLSTRAGGLGINLTAADTVIFYDSDWNPTIDSQAMDRAHRLGQTKQVRVYRLITRGTIEERILQRAKQKASVQQVVVGNGDMGELAGKNVDFNEGARQMAYFLMNDEDDEVLQRQLEMRAREKEEEDAKKIKPGPKKGTKRKKLGAGALDGVNALEDMYHEGEGHFDDGSGNKAGTESVEGAPVTPGKGKKAGGAKAKGAAKSHRRKSTKERLAYADGTSGNNFDGEDDPMAQ